MAHRAMQYGLQSGSPAIASLTQRIEAIRTDSRDRASRIVNCGGRDFSDRRLAKTANLVFQTPPWAASPSNEPRPAVRRNYSTERQPAGRRSIASKVGELCKDNATRATRSRGETRRRELYDTKMGLRRSTISRLPATAPKSTQIMPQEHIRHISTRVEADAVRETPRPAIQRCDRTPTSVAALDANLHYRSHMEDGHKLIDRLFSSKDDLWSFYGVYDGHGGRLVTDKCLQVLHELVLGQLITIPEFPQPNSEAVRGALEKSFAAMDEALRTRDAWHCGATCTVVLVHTSQNSPRKIYVANVGDSRCVLVSNDKHSHSLRVSVDHRATDPDEIHRVQSAGGMISRGRVGGQLMLTRALGDFALKHVGVSHVPFTLCRNLKADDAIIIASDGLWDVLSDADAGRTLLSAKAKHGNTKAVARALVESASSLGSTDNITCVVVFI